MGMNRPAPLQVMGDDEFYKRLKVIAADKGASDIARAGARVALEVWPHLIKATDAECDAGLSARDIATCVASLYANFVTNLMLGWVQQVATDQRLSIYNEMDAGFRQMFMSNLSETAGWARNAIKNLPPYNPKGNA